VGEREKFIRKRNKQVRCPRPRTYVEHAVKFTETMLYIPPWRQESPPPPPSVLPTGEGPGFLQPPVEP
jgi:hypothetical protein